MKNNTDNLVESTNSVMTAAEFLEKFHPGGPWPLTAIEPGNGPVTELTRSAVEVEAFVGQWNGRANIYFTPATPRDISRPPPSGKFRKEEIAGSDWQWVDMDPPSDADPIMWQTEAIMALVDPNLTPTIIVNSGRGYWAFWKRPAYSADPEEIEGVNRALAQKLGGDDCHNIDRLARLPGTVNLKTRQPAEVYIWNPTSVFVLPAPIAGVAKGAGDLDWSDCPDESEDAARIAVALNATVPPNAKFGDRASFQDLWERNVDKLERAFPPTGTGDEPYDGSAADASLAQRLAFYCEKRSGWIHRLMFKSALVRDKWEVREDYLERTISRAISLQDGTYKPGDKNRAPKIRPEADKPVVGHSGATEQTTPVDPLKYVGDYLGAEEQADLFSGFVYIRDTNKILTPEGDMLDASRFRASYGRRNFILSRVNSKDTTDAWKAFTESQVFVAPWAHGKGFRPDLAYGEIHDYGVRKLVNTYLDPKTGYSDGDVSQFLDHLEKMLPVKRDREILLAYLAAVIQYRGTKFTWCPLVQGVQGNGKSMITDIMEYCVGVDYSHRPAANQLDAKHNDWMGKNLLAAVEDVHIPGHKMAMIEHLKPLISNPRICIEPKGVDQVTADTCCNWLLNANQKDALLADVNERRFAVFYCAQQTKEDIQDQRMGGDYFPKLWDWLKTGGGFQAVHGYLKRYEIPYELDPTGGANIAPATSSADDVAEATRSPLEAAILSCVDEERSGCRGGFLSPFMVDAILRKEGKMRNGIPNRGRADILAKLGYVPHPAFGKGGKAPRVIEPDGARVRIYCRKGESPGGDDREKVAAHYEAAQGFS